MQRNKAQPANKKKWYWIATHSMEPCMFCPTKIHPVLKCSVIMEFERDGTARVYSPGNGCTAWVPKNKLFETRGEAWADYQRSKEHNE